MARENSPPDRVVTACSRAAGQIVIGQAPGRWRRRNASGSGPNAGRCAVRPSATSRSTDKRPFAEGILRQIGAALRQLAARQSRERDTVQADFAGAGPGQTRQRRQQCGFARAIGADHGDEIAGPRHQRNIAEDGAAAFAHAHMLRPEARSWRAPLQPHTSQKKKGVPTRLVKTPSFSSGPRWINRAAMSAINSSSAPPKVAGNRMRLG